MDKDDRLITEAYLETKGSICPKCHGGRMQDEDGGGKKCPQCGYMPQHNGEKSPIGEEGKATLNLTQCRNCGETNSPNEKHCKNCGTQLQNSKITSQTSSSPTKFSTYHLFVITNDVYDTSVDEVYTSKKAAEADLQRMPPNTHPRTKVHTLDDAISFWRQNWEVQRDRL